MKTTYKHIAFAALALSAVACSQEDDFSLSYHSDPDAVRITAQVGTNDVTGGFTRSNPLGTDEEQAQFNTGDQISVTAGTQDPVTYQLGDNGWSPVRETYLKWETETMNVTAYYPVGKNNASATTFTVPKEYTEDKPIADADYMTYSGSQTKDDGKSISLAMQRKMVRIVLDEITFKDQFATGYSVTTIKVHGNTKGYAGGQPEAGDVTVTAFKQDNTFYALLAPTTADTEATFMTVTVSNDTDSQELIVKGIPATTAGNTYSFSLTVGKDMMKMGTVCVENWTGATIEGGEAIEERVITVIEGNTATITVLDAATDAMMQNAMTEVLADNATLLMINGQLTDSQQTVIAEALTGKSGISLVMGGVTTPATSITELTGIDLAYKGGMGENGYVVTEDGYIITSKDGLDAWKTAADSNLSTNLTLACDIDYNSNWTTLGGEYTGVINGNGYAIVGLQNSENCATFIITNKGVIKHLGMVGGTFSSSSSDDQKYGSYGFVFSNNGTIMGCYNTSSCTAYKTGSLGNAAGIAYRNVYGNIIACYNTGNIEAQGSRGSGIVCFNYNYNVLGCYNIGNVSAVNNGYFAPIVVEGESLNCYYTQPNSGNKDGDTKVEGSDWTEAMNGMNAAIEEYNKSASVKCNYRYAINTNSSTNSTQPLVIVAVPAAE